MLPRLVSIAFLALAGCVVALLPLPAVLGV